MVIQRPPILGGHGGQCVVYHPHLEVYTTGKGIKLRKIRKNPLQLAFNILPIDEKATLRTVEEITWKKFDNIGKLVLFDDRHL
ncbi:hypothetical protein J1TS5_03280 [Paenibacillus macerans]|uniref:hypothetical protein n=1 Tax=Paenibacillus macerans TaxID=44252 RepID=UPI001B08161D|nr:hypothetical protein [Paenibacillus macerans]GIP08158.1 hypothetical protein J1TS5_03280 [Paenibacillus macerans]